MRVVIDRVSTGAALLAAAFLAFPLAVSAQSLGEAAERAKKERKGGKAKVITESELRRAGSEPPVTSSETTEASASKETPKEGTAAAAPAKVEKTEEELRAEAEAKWRERLQKANDEVTRLRDEQSQVQRALNDVSQNLYGATRTGLLNRLDAVNKDLATAQQSVSDLQEEGRRSRYR
jgi:chromatin segregation and condensation protein Rec8/ScpA/Scc1 (kleisin family)